MRFHTLLKIFCLCNVLSAIAVFAEMRIAITEILKDPAGLESAIPGGASHEFIEFVNLGPDTLLLDRLYISDGVTVDSVIPWQQALAGMPHCCFNRASVLPGRFAVMLDRDYTEAPTTSHYTIADSTVILTVPASSIVGGLTETRGVFLYRGSRTQIVDSLAACMDPGYKAILGSKVCHTPPPSAKEGFSCVPQRLLMGEIHYTTSPDTVSPGRYEYMQEQWLCEYSLINPGPASPSVQCTLALLQAGYGASKSAAWSVQANTGLAPVAKGTLALTKYPALLAVALPKDSVGYIFNIEDRNAQASFPLIISGVWLPRSPIVINEIFPRADSRVPEWIELLNTSSMPVNLKNWRYGTPEGTDTITTEDVLLGPDRYCVLTKSVSQFSLCYPVGITVIQPLHWQSLDNYRDTLFLISPLEASRCESVYYDHTWFESWGAQSLARVAADKDGLDRKAWALAGKPSPGLPNANTIWQSGERASLTIGPVPFTPNNDGIDDSLSIILTLPAAQKASIAIYGFDGRVLYDLQGQPTDRNSWNGRKKDGSSAPCGPFFVVATITNRGAKTVIRKKGILWR